MVPLPPPGRSPARLTARLGLAACLAWGLLGAACGPAGPARPAHPNFVIFLVDDLGWADVGYQGSTFHRTPNIDALAHDGLVFTQAYSASPVCSPSRAAIVTGCAPARLHITTAYGPLTPFDDLESRLEEAEPDALVPPTVSDRLPDDLPTLGGGLQELGYKTALIGKWHLQPGPLAEGFDVQIGASPMPTVTSYFSPYDLPTLPDGPQGEYLTDRLTDEAVRFLEANRDRPFLLVLSHYALHTPLEAPAELVEAYRQRADPEALQRNPTYAAMLERIDDSLGRVRRALEELGLARDTLLVFTSDNGGFERSNPNRPGERVTSNLPLRSGKGRVYEGGLRVPFVAWGGLVGAKGVCDVPVVGTDLCPTLLALAGHAPYAVCDGVDVSPLLDGARSLPRQELYFHFPHESYASALRAGNEKLVYSWKRETSELYDLAADPGEEHDLAARQPARVAELQQRLFRWLDEVGAARPVRVGGAKR